MPKRIDKNTFTDTALIAVMISLAACGRLDVSADTGATPREHEVPIHPARMESALTLPTLVEQRHFAIYRTYRVLFDDSPDMLLSRADEPEDGPPAAGMPIDMPNARGLPACSMRALLMQPD